jgi:hypothetical protein
LLSIRKLAFPGGLSAFSLTSYFSKFQLNFLTYSEKPIGTTLPGCSGMAPAHSRRPSMAGCEAAAANHHRGNSFGGQNRYEPNPNIRLPHPATQL